MVDSQILLSIIIPAFNAENYIEKCINRIVPLLDCDVECIVVVDLINYQNTDLLACL